MVVAAPVGARGMGVASQAEQRVSRAEDKDSAERKSHRE